MFNLMAGIFGLILLTLGSDVLIRAAKSLGLRFGLSATTIGVIVIGYGTSLPELSSSYISVLQGKSSLTGRRVGRIEGIILLSVCLGYFGRLLFK